MRFSRTKTKGMRCEFEELERERQMDLEIDMEVIEEVEKFKYLGSVVQRDGNLDAEITNRIQSGWNKWRKCSSILCDKRIPVRLKSRIQRQVVRPAMLYGSETWASRRSDEKRLDVTEMRMLRWAFGITRRDQVRNEHIRGSMRIAKISNRVKESRLRWFGHLRRRENNHPTRRIMNLEPPGRRRRGRPYLRWQDCVNRDMREIGARIDDCLERNRWRDMLQNRYSDPK